MAYLYKHIRLDKNEPFYIGIGEDKFNRNYQYIRAYTKHGRNKYWNNIINKTQYKIEIILENLTWEQACKKEKEFIKLYGRRDLGLGSLVNMTDGGDGQYGRLVSKDTCDLIKKSKINQRPATLGKRWKCKVPVSFETRMYISQNKTRANKIKEKNSKPVLQYDLNGNFIKEFPSVTQAKLETNIKAIDRAARGINKTAGKFIWKYKLN